MLDKETDLIREVVLSTVKETVSFNSYMEQWDWDDNMALISEYMEVEGYTGFWFIQGTQMGWLNRTGYKFAKAELGLELVMAIIPNTDVDGTFSFYENMIELKLSHHDSPTGEYYTIKPVSEEQYLGEPL